MFGVFFDDLKVLSSWQKRNHGWREAGRHPFYYKMVIHFYKTGADRATGPTKRYKFFSKNSIDIIKLKRNNNDVGTLRKVQKGYVMAKGQDKKKAVKKAKAKK